MATPTTSRLSGNDLIPVQPRPRLLDDDALFLDQALLMVNGRADAIKLLPAKRAETRTVHAVELGFQPAPSSKATREVAMQSGQSVLLRLALGVLAPSLD